MRLVYASLALTIALFPQASPRAAGPRIAPVPDVQRTGDQQALAAKFASSSMPNAVATYLWARRAPEARQAGLVDVELRRIVQGPDANGWDPFEAAAAARGGRAARGLIAIGGYRATSTAINSAGVQLDANIADFRFPPALR